MTKHYMQFEDFKRQILLEADEEVEKIDDKDLRYPGGIYWTIVFDDKEDDKTGKNKIHLYYALDKTLKDDQRNKFDTQIKEDLIKTFLFKPAGAPYSIDGNESEIMSNIKKVQTKFDDDYELKHVIIPFTYTSTDPNIKKTIRDAVKTCMKAGNKASIFTMSELKDYSGDLCTSREDINKAVIRLLDKMINDPDKFTGYGPLLKKNIKKAMNMTTDEFIRKYSNYGILNALILKGIFAGAKKVYDWKKGNNKPSSDGSTDPKWTTNPIGSITITKGRNKTIELNNFVVSNKENAKFEIVSGNAEIDETNKMTVNSGTEEAGKSFTVKVNLKNSKTNAKIGEKEFKFDVVISEKIV